MPAGSSAIIIDLPNCNTRRTVVSYRVQPGYQSRGKIICCSAGTAITENSKRPLLIEQSEKCTAVQTGWLAGWRVRNEGSAVKKDTRRRESSAKCFVVVPIGHSQVAVRLRSSRFRCTFDFFYRFQGIAEGRGRFGREEILPTQPTRVDVARYACVLGKTYVIDRHRESRSRRRIIAGIKIM